jgi:hypothetical protein
VSGTQSRLRELLDIAAGEPPGSLSVSVTEVRRLARRRRIGRGAAAASAACAVAALGVVVSTLAAGPPTGSSPGPGRLPPATGVPRYYVQQQYGPATGVPDAVVRDTATGAVTATVHCPWAGALISGRIAPTGDEAFFVACLRTRESGVHTLVVGSRIYRFQVTSTGAIAGYSLVPGGMLPGLSVTGLTAAADGSQIAMSAFPGGRGLLLGQIGTGDIVVINTRTGAHAVWHGTLRPQSTAPSLLTLSPDGRDLAVVVQNSTFGAGIPQDIEVAQVSPAGRGGLLSSARVLVHVPAPTVPTLVSYAQLGADGSVLTVGELLVPDPVPPSRVPRPELVVEQISVATGKVIHVLFTGLMRTTSGFGGKASSDPSGRYIIVSYGSGQHHSNGWLDHGHLVPLTPATAANPGYETW